ncbi:thioesterase family protein [Kocuria flava]|uniref:acyl-CoA thioesterase n=1 Tax=Kocuria flava TaxID=446860 RepID=UPI001FF6244B|nr:thioesterase family protein [Kocuria flava]MCJ8505117.1 thioesterase family protein [Kocuria flava]
MTRTVGAGVLCRVPMRWGDMDPYGHVNNVEVVRLLEEARIAALGVPVGTGDQVEPPLIPFFSELPEGTQALISEHRIKYLRALEYRNTPVEVRVWVVAARGGALVLGFEITDVVTRRACVRAETSLAFFVPATGTVLRISPEQQAVLAPYAGDPVFR